jgi:hypothetical protein
MFHLVEGVVPLASNGEVLDAEAAANRGYDGLHSWMGKAEAVWTKNAESDTMTLSQRWNYHNELGAQFPLAPVRLVYAKAGTHPAACIIRNSLCIIDHMLYWASMNSDSEALYLEAIFNSETARARSEKLQSRGQWGARHFDKVIFNLSIPRFDPNDPVHAALARAAADAERIAATVELPQEVKFQRARGMIRGAVTAAGVATRIDDLVVDLLDGTNH